MSRSALISSTLEDEALCQTQKISCMNEKEACHKSLGFLIKVRNDSSIYDFTRVLSESYDYKLLFHYSLNGNIILATAFVLLLIIQCFYFSRKRARKELSQERKVNAEIGHFARLGAKVSSGNS